MSSSKPITGAEKAAEKLEPARKAGGSRHAAPRAHSPENKALAATNALSGSGVGLTNQAQMHVLEPNEQVQEATDLHITKEARHAQEKFNREHGPLTKPIQQNVPHPKPQIHQQPRKQNF